MSSGALPGLSPAYGTIYIAANSPDRRIHTVPYIAKALGQFFQTELACYSDYVEV